MRRTLHADLDAFYASVEQSDHPRLRGQPMAYFEKRDPSFADPD